MASAADFFHCVAAELFDVLFFLVVFFLVVLGMFSRCRHMALARLDFALKGLFLRGRRVIDDSKSSRIRSQNMRRVVFAVCRIVHGFGRVVRHDSGFDDTNRGGL